MKNKTLWPLYAIAAALIVLRVTLLPVTPPGFFLDEAATGAHVASMLHGWANAHGTAWPLFSESLGGGYTTPVYLYPLVGWAAVFGPSELALRYFSAMATITAIVMIGYGVRLWLGRRAGVTAVIAGLALPWGWLQGSLAWDPALVPLLVAGAFVAFTRLLQSDQSLVVRRGMLAVLPAALIGLAYLYPPMRVTAPLLFVAAYVLLVRRHVIGTRGLIATGLASAALALPLALFMITPEALGRSQALSVFHGHSIFSGLWLAFTNFLGLVNPLYLFATGDPNLRHATGVQGMLGIAAVLPVAAVIIGAWRRPLLSALPQPARQLLLISLFGVAASLLGSALTNEGQPHSLRATGAWMFIVIIIAIGWQHIAASWPRRLTQLAIIISAGATVWYAADLALLYPARAAGSFDVPQRSAIYQHQPTPGYPDLARRYYQIR